MAVDATVGFAKSLAEGSEYVEKALVEGKVRENSEWTSLYAEIAIGAGSAKALSKKPGGGTASNTPKLAGKQVPKKSQSVGKRVSQKQYRHVADRKEYRGGGYLDTVEDAQEVLDAYHSGNVEILGETKQGFSVVRYEGVTGTNVNQAGGYTNQPTNVFMIKGTTRPSVVPMQPEWSQK